MYSEDEFIFYNPWLKRRIQSEIDRDFPILFRKYAEDSRTYHNMVEDLRRETEYQQDKIATFATEKKREIDNIVKQNIKAFSDQKDFAELQRRIENEQNSRFVRFQGDLKRDHDERQNSYADRVINLEKENSTLRKDLDRVNQRVTRVGIFSGLFPLITGLGILFYNNK